jgi:surface protein
MEKISENSNLFIKFQNLEKKLLAILNLKLEVKLSDKEIKLDLNNKNIGNIEFGLLRGINFKNLEELDLSHNNISDITLLKDFNLNKLKKIDLSPNNIEQIEDIKFKNLEKIDLSFNNISKLSKIDLSLNKIIDLNEVKFLEKFKKIDILDFLKEIQNIKLKINNLLKDENIASNNKIRIFGEEFVKNNKNNCVIFINNKEKELSEFYEYAQNENVIFVRLKMNEKVNSFNEMFKDCSSLISFNEGNNWNLSNINDMSYMFYNCESLGFLSRISKWDTSNVINMDYLFYNCLSLIPFPDISKWNISKVKRKTDMFNGCSNVNIKILNKFK